MPVRMQRLDVIDIHPRPVLRGAAAGQAGGRPGQVRIAQALPFHRSIEPLDFIGGGTAVARDVPQQQRERQQQEVEKFAEHEVSEIPARQLADKP